jgi:hypothetical protein
MLHFAVPADGAQTSAGHAPTWEKTMNRPIAALLLSAAVLPLADTANAASLTSGKKLEIRVDEAKVEDEKKALWAQFGGWCAIAEWHPAVKSCEETKEGDTEFRTLTLQDGGKIKEKLLDRGNASYRYEIIESPLPVKNYEAQFTVTPDDDDLDEVNIVWAATYDAADGKEDAEARKTIDGIFKDGIASIKGKLGDKVVDKKKKKDDD